MCCRAHSVHAEQQTPSKEHQARKTIVRPATPTLPSQCRAPRSRPGSACLSHRCAFASLRCNSQLAFAASAKLTVLCCRPARACLSQKHSSAAASAASSQLPSLGKRAADQQDGKPAKRSRPAELSLPYTSPTCLSPARSPAEDDFERIKRIAAQLSADRLARLGMLQQAVAHPSASVSSHACASASPAHNHSGAAKALSSSPAKRSSSAQPVTQLSVRPNLQQRKSSTEQPATRSCQGLPTPPWLPVRSTAEQPQQPGASRLSRRTPKDKLQPSA